MRATLTAVSLFGALVFTSTLAAADSSGTKEMQAQRQSQRAGSAMTPQRARRECWQQFGVSPGSPRNAYRASLQPQVETCVAQKMRR